MPVKCVSNNRQIEFGKTVDVHSGCYMQYSKDDGIYDLMESNLRIENRLDRKPRSVD
jgi:hypothetical protein